MARATVLISDDEARVRQSLKRILREEYRVLEADSGAATLDALDRTPVDLVVLDYYLLDTDASVLLPRLLKVSPSPEVVVISGKANTKEAVACLKLGAFDFILKPYEIEELLATIGNALRKRRLELERHHLLEHSLERFRIVGSSRPMEELRSLIKRYADSEATVLILGETGTGKELVAHQLHFRSQRAGGPFKLVNCVAIPRDLADSELFGHSKGAFTGAVEEKAGKVEMADGGTLFLDEIGDISQVIQAKLLRFLETREFERLGENRVRISDVRVIAATHRDLRAAVAVGKFREDLFYRLDVCTISIPPLREHKEDLPELVELFVPAACARHNKPLKRFSDSALAALIADDWPGNVRELLHLVEHAVIHFPKEELDAADMSLLRKRAGAPGEDEDLSGLLALAERDIILSRLVHHGGRIDATAASLGIHRGSLHRKMSKLGIFPK